VVSEGVGKGERLVVEDNLEKDEGKERKTMINFPLPEKFCWWTGGIITIISILLFIFKEFMILSILTALSLCVFLGFLIWECASRTTAKKGPHYVELPTKRMALILFFLLLVSNITIFANIYLKTGEIEKAEVVMSERSEAIYFSAVTVTTLGYGEFYPTEKFSRLVVVFHLFSGMLLLLFALPILASRISSWEGTTEVLDCLFMETETPKALDCLFKETETPKALDCLFKEEEKVVIDAKGKIVGEIVRKGEVEKKE